MRSPPLCVLFPHRTKLNSALLALSICVHYIWLKWPLEPFGGGEGGTSLNHKMAALLLLLGAQTINGLRTISLGSCFGVQELGLGDD